MPRQPTLWNAVSRRAVSRHAVPRQMPWCHAGLCYTVLHQPRDDVDAEHGAASKLQAVQRGKQDRAKVAEKKAAAES